jgi:rubrerythrin
MKRSKVGVAGIVVLLFAGLAGTLMAAENKETATLANLQTAYSGESNAKARYEAFAAKADEEGYKSVAVLFRAAAESEAIHAKNFATRIKKMGAEPKMTAAEPDVKSTKENLEASLKGEVSAAESMYPNFIQQADADKDSGAAMGFKGAHAAEVEYGKFFKTALDGLDEWKALGKEFAVCQVCGFTVMGQPPMTCPVCSAPKEKFKVFSK